MTPEDIAELKESLYRNREAILVAVVLIDRAQIVEARRVLVEALPSKIWQMLQTPPASKENH